MSTVIVRVSEPNWIDRQWRSRPEHVWLGLVLLLGLVLRAIRLGTWSYWHDEAYNLIQAEHLPALLHGEYVSNHPPLFPALVAVWRLAGLGETEFTMRLLPVLIGLCGVAALYLLGKTLFGARAGLFAAFLLAISPLHIVHSQDLKPYIVLPCTGVLAAYFLFRAVEENRSLLWAAYGVTAALACYSEFFAGPLLLALNAWVLGRLRGHWDILPGWITSNVIGALLFLPYLGVLLDKAGNIMIDAEHWWIPKPSLPGVIFYLKAIAFGYSGSTPHWKIALVVFGITALAGVASAWKHNRSATVLLLTWFIIPTVLVYMVSLFTNSIFLIRAMIPFALPAYLFAGLAAASVRSITGRTAGLVLFACLAAFPLWQRYRADYTPLDLPHRPGIHPPRAYRQAAEFILDRWQEGDVAIHPSPATWLPFYWYGFRHTANQYVAGLGSGFRHAYTAGNPRTQSDPAFDAWFPQELQLLVEGRNRVWFIFSEWERKNLTHNPIWVWRWLDNHYAETGHWHFPGIELFLFERHRDGLPIVTVARDRDDGVSAEITYAGGIDSVYTKVCPDAGIEPLPDDLRRGRLRLRFGPVNTGAAEREVTYGGAGPPQAAAVFTVENTSAEQVECLIDAATFDRVVPIIELSEENPESDLWVTEWMHNPSSPPPSFNIPVVYARMSSETAGNPAALVGAVDLKPGEYETFICMLGVPRDARNLRGDLRIHVGAVDIASPVPRARDGQFAWHWFRGAPVLAVNSEELPIRIEASSLPGMPESFVDLAYLAFRATAESYPPDGDPIVEPWPGRVSLEPHTARSWVLHGCASETHVWVFDRQEQGKAYWIFRRPYRP